MPPVPLRKPPQRHLGRDGAATSLAEDASSSLPKRRFVRLLLLSHSPGCGVGVVLVLAYCLAANIDLRASRRNEEVALIHQHIVVGFWCVFFFIRRKHEMSQEVQKTFNICCAPLAKRADNLSTTTDMMWLWSASVFFFFFFSVIHTVRCGDCLLVSATQ